MIVFPLAIMEILVGTSGISLMSVPTDHIGLIRPIGRSN